MDNENQVKTGLLETTKLFLDNPFTDLKQSVEVYSLEEEFAKTKKNRNVMLYVVIIAVMAALGAGVYYYSAFIEKRVQSAEVEFDEFADINLQEVLSGSQNLETQLRLLEIELEGLQEEWQEEILNTKEDSAAQLELLLTQDLTSEEKSAGIVNIDNQEEETLAELEANYTPMIEDLEAQIAEIEAEIAEYELLALDVAERQDQIEYNYQVLYDLRMEELESTYEERIEDLDDQYDAKVSTLQKNYEALKAALILKYNPKFDLIDVATENGVRLSSATIAQARLDDTEGTVLTLNDDSDFYFLNDEGIYNLESYFHLRQKQEFANSILDRLISTSYTNSVPLALTSLQSLMNSAMNDYESIWLSASDTISEKNEIIAQYYYALEYYCDLNRDSGFILDERDEDNIIIFLRDIYTIPSSGSAAIVYRGSDEEVGRIKVYPSEDGYRAEVTSLNSGYTIQPLDKILLLLQEAQ